ncbi:MAG: TonB-dependent receptor plug domain-containing protein, partial [Bacteroidales bacterium]
AIGIKRAEKTLGYAATSVSSEDICKARESSLMNSLQGKVAGVVVSGGGGTPGASTKVILRGYSSLSGSNNPLYIVDGTPIDNGTAIGNGTDFGNGANSINPDDVENVTILKGAAATALYGSRAANGVIMITTKSGKGAKEKGIKVEYTTNFTYTNFLRLPQFQNVFGQGWSGHFAYEENGSWGPKFDGKIRKWGAVYNNSQQIKPFVALESNVADFYETGVGRTNTLSLSGGDEKRNFYFSYANNYEDGVLPS